MRYSRDETTYILGNFDSGDTVTIDVYRLSDDAQVVSGASCSEVGTTGIFKYSFTQTISSKEEYVWIMSNGSFDQRGKIVLGGYMDTIQADLDNPDQYKADVSALALESTAQAIKAKTDTIDWNDVEEILKLTGNKVTKSGNIITIYEDDGTTPWRRYDLSNGGRVQV